MTTEPSTHPRHGFINARRIAIAIGLLGIGAMLIPVHSERLPRERTEITTQPIERANAPSAQRVDTPAVDVRADRAVAPAPQRQEPAREHVTVTTAVLQGEE